MIEFQLSFQRTVSKEIESKEVKKQRAKYHKNKYINNVFIILCQGDPFNNKNNYQIYIQK